MISCIHLEVTVTKCMLLFNLNILNIYTIDKVLMPNAHFVMFLTSLFPPAALFLLDNRLEVYLWQREPPEQMEMESPAPARGRWQSEQRCAMETALQYCRGRTENQDVCVCRVRATQHYRHFFLFCPRVPEVNPRRPPLAYLISEGSEPLTFTNVFPHWERSPEANTQVQTAEFQMNIYPALVTR